MQRTPRKVVGVRHARTINLRFRSAYTLIDLLVSIAVIGVLISLLLPSLSMVRETTRRVVCSSNARQHGLGFAMYVEDYKFFPSSKFEPKDRWDFGQPQQMMLARTDDNPAEWDGLGVLFSAGYLDAPQIFYCPSHKGQHPFAAYAQSWRESAGKIVINYQYRGGQAAASVFSSFPDRVVFLADGMQTQSDFSHGIGTNVLRADYSVLWLKDQGRIKDLLPADDADAGAATKVADAWNKIDESVKEPGK